MTTSRKYARQPAATQIEAWKRVLAARRRQQRARRWKRPPPAVTGIRIQPPADRTDSKP